MRLAVVNCIHAGPKPNTFTPCALKLFGGRPGVAMCRSCANRAPRHEGDALAWADGEKPDGKPKLSPDEYRLCHSRLKEEWSAEWQAKILASVIRNERTCYIIPRAMWEVARTARK